MKLDASGYMDPHRCLDTATGLLDTSICSQEEYDDEVHGSCISPIGYFVSNPAITHHFQYKNQDLLSSVYQPLGMYINRWHVYQNVTVGLLALPGDHIWRQREYHAAGLRVHVHHHQVRIRNDIID